MTEKELDILQKDIYWTILNQFNNYNIPPLIQKIIMEGIYSRFQTKADSYNWQLKINEYAENNKKTQEQTEMEVPDYMKEPSNEPIPDYIKDSKGEPNETPEGVTYK